MSSPLPSESTLVTFVVKFTNWIEKKLIKDFPFLSCHAPVNHEVNTEELWACTEKFSHASCLTVEFGVYHSARQSLRLHWFFFFWKKHDCNSSLGHNPVQKYVYNVGLFFFCRSHEWLPHLCAPQCSGGLYWGCSSDSRMWPDWLSRGFIWHPLRFCSLTNPISAWWLLLVSRTRVLGPHDDFSRGGEAV